MGTNSSYLSLFIRVIREIRDQRIGISYSLVAAGPR